jgi:hypothetical protein
MSEDKKVRELAPNQPANIEEHGIDVGTVAGVVSAGATVYMAVQQSRKPNDPPPPEPPKIELPPGVDRD